SPLFVPAWTGSAGVSYEIPVAKLHGQITPRLDMVYQSSLSFSSTSAVASVPARALLNGRVTYTTDNGDWTFAVGATNLLNKVYYLNIFDLTAFGQPTTEGQPGAPREWYVSLKRKF
ncbi:MAG TPA: TonB-dependent receptor, partial [Novosphingobium sp.]|nr:TonB-dependent receptor [Novosphingobium sp.]